MPLRAFRLLPLPTTSEATLANSLSFASTLQLAAGRAWARRVCAHGQHKNGTKRSIRTTASHCHETKRTPTQAGPSTLRSTFRPASNLSNGELHNHNRNNVTKWPKVSEAEVPLAAATSVVQSPPSTQSHPKCKPRTANVVHFDPKLNGYEPSDAEIHGPEPHPHKGEDYFNDIPPKALGQTTNLASVDGFRATTSPMLPTPNSHSSLYRNLLYLVNMSKPAPRLPALVDYHDLYPEWHSTRSYNLLIFLAIRHRAYGIVRVLLEAQEQRRIPKDTESYKLVVRALVHQGMWEDAWKYAQQLKEHRVFPRNANGEVDIPFPIWLEFCLAPRKKRMRARSVYNDDGRLLERFFEKVVEQPEELRARQRMLNESRPMSMPPLAQTSPYAIYCIVQLLMRSGNRERAMELTKAFFGVIPRSVKHNHIAGCLNIIHTHMAFSPAKNGLPRFYEARRTLVALLKLHPALRPTSRTLYLLLAPLQRAKRCGTVAWAQLRAFKSEWGPRVEDRKVQRRVSNLALKEGRLDIVAKMNMVEKRERRHRQERLLELGMSHGLTPTAAAAARAIADGARLPLRQIYTRNGREARLWVRLRARIRCKLYRTRKRDQSLSAAAKRSRSTTPTSTPTQPLPLPDSTLHRNPTQTSSSNNKSSRSRR